MITLLSSLMLATIIFVSSVLNTEQPQPGRVPSFFTKIQDTKEQDDG